jgi:hypothetical protein
MKRMMVLLGVAGAAWASSLRPHSLAERAQAADRVAVITVVDQRVEAEAGDLRRLKTLTTLEVRDAIKGGLPPERRFTITQVGGRHGPYLQGIAGDAELKVGETAVVFARCQPNGPCVLVALSEGKLHVEGEMVRVHDLFTDEWSWRPLAVLVSELRKAVGT